MDWKRHRSVGAVIGACAAIGFMPDVSADEGALRALAVTQLRLSATPYLPRDEADSTRRLEERAAAQRVQVIDRSVLAETRGTGSDLLLLAQANQQQPDKPVGRAPPAKTEPTAAPEVQAIPEIGGVLTPSGRMVVEPSLQYSNSQVNRFTFQGIEVIEALLVGIIEAQDADRDTMVASLTGRLGLTNRLEIETKVPYVYRDDTLTSTIPQAQTSESDPPPQISRDLDGNGLGDIEAALHYQVNRGVGGWPFFIANVRYKSDTGDGPFDVSRNADGVQTEAPTGSGFHSVEPSVTVLYPSDPAVFFANLGYSWNIEKDVGKTFGPSDEPQRVGDVDPGDAVRLSFGMAYSVNERASFTLGYKQDFIEESSTVINGAAVDSSTLKVGAALLGFGFQVNERVGVNLNLELGITADAPDVLMTLRVPTTFDVF